MSNETKKTPWYRARINHEALVLVLQFALGVIISIALAAGWARGEFPKFPADLPHKQLKLVLLLLYVALFTISPILILVGRKWAWYLEVIVVLPMTFQVWSHILRAGVSRDFFKGFNEVLSLAMWTTLPIACLIKAIKPYGEPRE